ncbi:MAG: hypothetical protein ACK5F7_11175 [Planctomycetaceae bacterium]
MAHQDLWDPKPEAPAEIRGDFTPIQTKVPGLQLTNILPRMSQVADSACSRSASARLSPPSEPTFKKPRRSTPPEESCVMRQGPT